MSEQENVRLHVTIDGRVQGVGYRYYVLENALPRQLTGWVQNSWDGKVEVVAEGRRKELERLLELLRRGPRAAFVTNVDPEWLPATGEFSRFDVRGTS